jgi:hypothetical protein
MPRCAFELDRFVADHERLRVSGRWLGVRGRRFVRPSLAAVVDGHQTRALAELEHKPWDAAEGDEWVAAFKWSGPVSEVEEFELAVAPDLAVRLPPPDSDAREIVLPAVAPETSAASDAAPAPERGVSGRRDPGVGSEGRDPTVGSEGRDPAVGSDGRDPATLMREQADAVRRNALSVRNRALSDLDRALSERDRALAQRAEFAAQNQSLTAERDRLLGSLEHTRGKREQLLEELRSTKAHRDALAAEHERLVNELARVRADRDRLVAKRDSIAADADAGRERMHSELAQAQQELVRLRAALADAAGPVPAPPPTSPWNARFFALGAFAFAIMLIAIIVPSR